jgi:hypothetical protein
MTIDKVDSFNATIYVGLRDSVNENEYTIQDVEAICQEFVDAKGQCVTVTPTEFVYTNGKEPGASIGFINYPRFPSHPMQITADAMNLAKKLLLELRQQRVSVVCNDKTYMLTNDELINFIQNIKNDN